MPDWKEFRDILPSACLSVDSIPIYTYKSEPEADSGHFSWDWAGAWLHIRFEFWAARSGLDLGQMPIKFD